MNRINRSVTTEKTLATAIKGIFRRCFLVRIFQSEEKLKKNEESNVCLFQVVEKEVVIE